MRDDQEWRCLVKRVSVKSNLFLVALAFVFALNGLFHSFIHSFPCACSGHQCIEESTCEHESSLIYYDSADARAVFQMSCPLCSGILSAADISTSEGNIAVFYENVSSQEKSSFVPFYDLILNQARAPPCI